MHEQAFGISAPTPEETAKAGERMKEQEVAAERQRERERKRKEDLERRRPAIERALKAYQRIEDRDVLEVRIRTGFIQTTDPRRTAARPAGGDYSLAADIESRPPMTKLVERRRHSLQLLMTMFYVARMEASPGQQFVNDHPNINPKGTKASWLTLAGLNESVPPTQRRNLRRSFNTAVDALAAHDLVALHGTPGFSGRYRNFALQAEDGTNTPYTVPGDNLPNREAISLSTSFFREGWHLVLTDHELVTLLAIIDRTGALRRTPRSGTIRDEGVDLKESVRYGTYGLSDEAYNTVHMLHRLGLITWKDPMPNRRSQIKLVGFPIDGSGIVDPANPAGPEKVDFNERVPYRLIYPIHGKEFGSALDKAFDTLAS